MSLNWDTTNIKNNDTVCWLPKNADGDELMRPVTNSIIWATMGTDIGHITEANAYEFFLRNRIIGTIYNAPETFTLQDVIDHVGLKVNVLTLTMPKFLANFNKRFKAVNDERERKLKLVKEIHQPLDKEKVGV